MVDRKASPNYASLAEPTSELTATRLAKLDTPTTTAEPLTDDHSASSEDRRTSDGTSSSSVTGAASSSQFDTSSVDEEWEGESQRSFSDSFQPCSDKEGHESSHVPDHIKNGSQTSDVVTDSESEIGSSNECENLTANEKRYSLALKTKVVDKKGDTVQGDVNSSFTAAELASLIGTEYIDATVGHVLAQGLAEIVKRNPKKPIEFLAAFLLADQKRIDKLQKNSAALSDDSDAELEHTSKISKNVDYREQSI